MMVKTASKKENPVRMESESVTGRYIEAIGRRKTSVARVRIVLAPKLSIFVNERKFETYFSTLALQKSVLSVFSAIGAHPPGGPESASGEEGNAHNFSVTAKVSGGGISSQAQAMRHGLSRALVSYESSWRSRLKVKGFLKRDPRAKERRKFGLKKARKAPQWSKR